MTTFSKDCSQSMSQDFDRAQHGLYQFLRQWFQIQSLKIAVAKEREQLSMLSDARLADLGITRFDAMTEALRHDLPVGRLKEIKNRQC